MRIDNELLLEAVNTFGRDNQINIIEEECIELATAIIKMRRKLTVSSMENLIDELADVAIVMGYAPILFDEAAIQERIDFKLERLRMRINSRKSKTCSINNQQNEETI
ncbi:hypothetical protein [Dyadobacter sp. CY312]|uniref:hypothetical protein n=1 Tax=Dyadobacter sp. CY312 TaxID=2907303 RepID=UPI001F2348D4|nr:hypothetical protein [Dyadobacter sp. CY312]MCE7039263.1 hypothetical protein [Dyadobacter sp. CY312]